MPGYWVDLFIIGIIALSVVTGLIRGFVKELIAICVWILAIWVAFTYSSSIDFWFENYIHDKTAKTAVAFVILLLAVLIAGAIVNALLSAILKRSGLSGTDRFLGMGFGLVRGIFIVALIMAALKMTSLPYQDFSRNSKLYTAFDPAVNWVYGMMPQFLKRAKIDKKQTLVDFESRVEEG